MRYLKPAVFALILTAVLGAFKLGTLSGFTDGYDSGYDMGYHAIVTEANQE